mgnify:CR=1 FL=1
MPLPDNYIGTQNDDQTRSIDAVPIEPSIREGRFLVSSLYGPNTSVPLTRYPPVNTAIPEITGDFVIPNILRCEPGQWDASPSPDFAFQWMSDGNDIPGATSQTWLSDLAYDETNITCEVRAYSTYGEGYAWTDDFYITRIEPVEANDLDMAIISGMGSEKFLTNQIQRTMIVSGVGAEDSQAVMRSVSYFLTGSGAEDRLDINSTYYYVLNGLGTEKQVLNRTNDIAVISSDVGIPLVESEPQLIRLRNPGAEMGMEGWDVFGTIQSEYGSTYEWERFFYGGDNALNTNVPYSYMTQEVLMDSAWFDDIDAGTCYYLCSWYQGSYEGSDQGNVSVEFYSDADVFLGSEAGPGLWGAPNYWFLRSMDEVQIPIGTRKIKVVVEFNLIAGNNNDGRIDYILTQIRKGDPFNIRDFGPTFSKWRLRFTSVGSYSGGGLQELEFRDGIGGTDLATGGSTLFGSLGIGGDVNYIFDDIRGNGGYWAGAENSIVGGTSWVGYDFGSDIKPAEIDITARQGTSANQLPKSFILEGSDDGARWIPVQEYTDYPIPTYGQQMQFEVLDGVQPKMIDDVAVPAFQNSSSVERMKGNMFRAKTRMEITDLCMNLKSSAIDTEIALCLFDYQFSGGHVLKVVETQDVTYTTANTWQDVPITPFKMEVGQLFMVLVLDKTTPSGVSAHRFNANADTFKGHLLADFLQTWRSNHTSVFVTMNGSLSTASPYLIDFKSTVY